MHVIEDRVDHHHVHSPPLDLSGLWRPPKYSGSPRDGCLTGNLALIPKSDPPRWDSRIGTKLPVVGIVYSHTHGVPLVYESLVLPWPPHLDLPDRALINSIAHILTCMYISSSQLWTHMTIQLFRNPTRKRRKQDSAGTFRKKKDRCATVAHLHLTQAV